MNDIEDLLRTWFPKKYDVRHGQREFIDEAHEVVKERGFYLCSAPCGIGKSIAVLTALVPLLRKGMKLIVYYRTRSQLDIYLKELRALQRRVSAVSFINKKDMCPLFMKDRKLTYFDFIDECKRLKRNCEDSVDPYCRYYKEILDDEDAAEKFAWAIARDLTPPLQVVKKAKHLGICAYEALRLVLPDVDVFLGTYGYVFNPAISKILLKSCGVNPSKVVVVVDEAHNLPLFAKDLLSDKLTHFTVEVAIRESKDDNYWVWHVTSKVAKLLEAIDRDIFDILDEEVAVEKVEKIEPTRIRDVLERNWESSAEDAAEVIHDYGEKIREQKKELGEPRIFSYTHKVGEFLQKFLGNTGPQYMHLASKDWKGRLAIEVRNLDGRALTSPILEGLHGGVLMSGFLSPLEIYRDLIFNPEFDRFIMLREFDSPFPSQNRLIVVASNVSSLQRERTPETFDLWRRYVDEVLAANEGNVAVFFTSYDLLHKIMPQIETDWEPIIEDRKTKRGIVVKQLERTSHAVLYGVMGGKLSEGIDYPGDVLTCVVAVGLPYATWNSVEKENIKYLNGEFQGRGRIYGYVTPAVLRLIQTCGRIHRSATDKGCIIILDKRVTHPRIRKLLPEYFQREMRVVRKPEDCAEMIRRFWREHNTWENR